MTDVASVQIKFWYFNKIKTKKHPTINYKWSVYKYIYIYNYFLNNFIKKGFKSTVQKEFAKFRLLDCIVNGVSVYSSKFDFLKMFLNTLTPVFFYKIKKIKKNKKKGAVYSFIYKYCLIKWRIQFLKRMLILLLRVVGVKKLRYKFLLIYNRMFRDKTYWNFIIMYIYKEVMSLRL